MKRIIEFIKDIFNLKEIKQENKIISKPAYTNKIIVRGNEFYETNEHIKPEYAHLKTPQYIIDEIKNNRLIIGKKEKYIGSTISVSYSYSYDSFIRDSLIYASLIGSECNHIPLKHYYTQFESLNKAQRQWYIYWRRQVLNKIYMETDLSYIYLFIYELINFSFNQNAAFNASMLATIGEVYEEVRHYTNSWLSDLLIEVDETKSSDSTREENNRLYNIMIKNNQAYDKISIGSWKAYISNSRETVFYANYKNTIYKIFKMGVVILNDYYLDNGSSLIDRWFNESEENRRRYLYSGAVFGRTVDTERIYRVIVRKDTDLLSPEVTALFKLSENITRGLFNEKRRIKVDFSLLPEGFEDIFNKYVNNNFSVNDNGERFKLVKNKKKLDSKHKIPSQPQSSYVMENTMNIEFDMNKIVSLSTESEILIKTFKEKGFDEEDDKMSVVTNSLKANIGNILLTEIDEDESSFVESLNHIEKSYIFKFSKLKYGTDDSYSFFKENGLMAGAFISDLNEKAFDFLGDNFIELNNDSYVIFEDYEGIVNLIQKEQFNGN